MLSFFLRFLTKTHYALLSYYTSATCSSQLILINLIALILIWSTNYEVLKCTLTLKDTDPKFRNKWSCTCFPPYAFMTCTAINLCFFEQSVYITLYVYLLYCVCVYLLHYVCVFAVLCVYCCFYFRCRTAG